MQIRMFVAMEKVSEKNVDIYILYKNNNHQVLKKKI